MITLDILNIPVTCLVDSGANCCIVDSNIAANFPKARREAHSAAITVANASKMIVREKLWLPLCFNNVVKYIDFLIVDGLNHQAVLGMSSWSSLTIDRREESITIDGACFDMVPSGRSLVLNSIVAATIAPQSLTPLRVKVPAGEDEADDILLVEPSTKGFCAENGVDVMQAAYGVKPDQVILVYNTSQVALTIPCGAEVATAKLMEKRDDGRYKFNELVSIDNEEFRNEWLDYRRAREIRLKGEDGEKYRNVTIGNELDDKQKTKVQKLLKQFRSVFSTGPTDLGMVKECAFRIRLTDETQRVYEKPIPVRPGLRDKAEKVIEDWCKAGVIERGASDFNLPLFFVKKGKDGVRPVLDARRLNMLTIPTRWPIPSLKELMSKLSRNISKAESVFVTSVDVASAFNQVRTAPEDSHKCAFSFLGRQYVSRRMCFGLANSPSVFAHVIDRLCGHIDGLAVLMDDIVLVHGSFEEHLRAVSEFLAILEEHGILLKIAKSHFFVKNFDYLGFKVTEEGIEPLADKLDPVRSFPRPRSRKELRRFLGLTNFYQHYVKDGQKTLSPLHKLAAPSKSPYQWKSQHEEAFSRYKEALLQVVSFKHRDESMPLVISTDACSTGIGACLYQRDTTGRLHPLGFFSRALSEGEQKLPSRYLELLGLVCGLEHFEFEIYMQPVYALTDHKSLQLVLHEKKMRQNVPVRVTNLFSRLSRFNVSGIEYVSCDKGVIVSSDALSRTFEISNDDDKDEDEDIVDRGFLNSIELRPRAPELLQVLQMQTRRAKRLAESAPDQEEPIMVSGDVPYRPKDIIQLQEIDPALRKMDKAGKLVKGANGLWVLRSNSDIIALPEQLHIEVASFVHAKMAHPGALALEKILKRKFFIAKIALICREVCSACEICWKIKPRAQLKGLSPPKPEMTVRPWQKLYIDLSDFGSLDLSGNRYFLGVMDDFSRFLVGRCLPDKSAETVAYALADILLSNGVQGAMIRADNGLEFRNTTFDSVMEKFNIRVAHISPYHAQSNRIERKFRSLGLKARLANINRDDWSRQIPFVVFMVNNAPTTALDGLSPSEVLTGRPMELPLFHLRPDPELNEDPFLWSGYLSGWLRNVGQFLGQKYRERSAHQMEPVRGITLEVGQKVCYWAPMRLKQCKKLHVAYKNKAEVVKILGQDVYEIRDMVTGNLLRRNVRFLRPLPSS